MPWRSMNFMLGTNPAITLSMTFASPLLQDDPGLQPSCWDCTVPGPMAQATMALDLWSARIRGALLASAKGAQQKRVSRGSLNIFGFVLCAGRGLSRNFRQRTPKNSPSASAKGANHRSLGQRPRKKNEAARMWASTLGWRVVEKIFGLFIKRSCEASPLRSFSPAD